MRVRSYLNIKSKYLAIDDFSRPVFPSKTPSSLLTFEQNQLLDWPLENILTRLDLAISDATITTRKSLYHSR